MRRVAVFLMLIIGVLLLGRPEPASAQTNLIRNPGFEAPYSAWSGIGPIQVAHEWTPWWSEQPDHNPAWFRPEWKPAEAALYPNRVLSGERAQQWFTFHASHYAGMYQQVFNVQPGVRYQFSIFAQVWSSTEDNPNVSVLPANPHLQIGIDPTGNWNPFSGDIIWSSEAAMAAVIDQWGYLVVEATASNNVITVFMKSNPDFANKHNDTYWDNANLIVAGPAPPPTDTPTAIPTATPVPPPTAIPSDTPVPPPTAIPTDTPIPPPATATPPPPTATDRPTDTPEPTATPPATATDTPPPPTEEPTATTEVILETIAPTDFPTALPAETDEGTTAIAVAPTRSDSTGGVAQPGAGGGAPPADESAESGPTTATIVIVLVGGLALLLVLVALLLIWRRVAAA